MPRKRTVLRSRSGTKLYAVRKRGGRFSDIQTYERAQGSDIKRRSKAEAAGKKRSGAVRSGSTGKTGGRRRKGS